LFQYEIIPQTGIDLNGCLALVFRGFAKAGRSNATCSPPVFFEKRTWK